MLRQSHRLALQISAPPPPKAPPVESRITSIPKGTDFPIFVFCREEPVADVKRYELPARSLRLAQKQVGLVKAINNPVRRDLGAGEFRDGGEQIHAVNQFVANLVFRNMARPANDKRAAARKIR